VDVVKGLAVAPAGGAYQERCPLGVLL